MRGQSFHLERWSAHFRDVDMISDLRVWVRISGLSVYYRDAKILEVTTKSVGHFIKAGENFLSSLNGFFC